MSKWLAAILLVLLMAGCSTLRQIEYVDVPRIEKEYIAKIDTTIIRDSVFINQFIKRDTVFLTKEKYKYVTKIQRDTLHRVDTVAVIKEVEVDKPYVPAYYKGINKAFWALMALLVGFILYKVIRLYMKIKTGGIL